MSSGNLGKSSAASTSKDGMGRSLSFRYLSSLAVSLPMVSARAVMLVPLIMVAALSS